MSDHYSRKWALLTSTIILFVFAALGAGSYGGGTVHGIFNALVAYRFLLGIGIGYVQYIWSITCLSTDRLAVENIQLAVLHVPKAQESSREGIGIGGSSCSPTFRSISDLLPRRSFPCLSSWPLPKAIYEQPGGFVLDLVLFHLSVSSTCG